MSAAWMVVCDSATRRSWLRGDTVVEPDLPREEIDQLYLHDEEAGIYLGPFEAVPLAHVEGSAFQLSLKDGTTKRVEGDDLREIPDTASTTGSLPEGAARFFQQAFNFAEEVDIDEDGRLPEGEIDVGAETEQPTVTASDAPATEDGRADDSPAPDLEMVIIEALDVEGLDLSDAALAAGQRSLNQTIRDCDLSSTEMKDVTFENVDLRGSSFRDARLPGVTFRDCRLAGVDFTDAKLQGAEFEGVSLTSCTFVGTNLNEADFTGLAMERVDLSETYLNDAVFDRTTPERATFDRAEMEDVSVQGTEFEHSSFVGVDFGENTALDGASFDDCDLRDVDLPGGNLSSTELTDTRFGGADLTNVTFDGGTYTNLDFTDAVLDGAGFEATTVDGGRFIDARLSEAGFEHANIEDGRFDDARLSEARFCRARLDGAVFDGAKADGARFDGTNLERTSFAQTNLAGAWFDDAALYGSLLASGRIDDATRFDDVCIYLRDAEDRPPGVEIEGTKHDRAVSVYRTLETVHEENALTAAARGYHRRRRRSQRRVAMTDVRIWDTLLNGFSALFVSYGLRFRRLIVWTGATILGAAYAYGASGWLVHERFGRLFFGMDGLSTWEVWKQTLLFSLLSFTGLSFGNFDPIGWGEWLSVAQAGLGVFVFALFVYIFTSRAAR